MILALASAACGSGEPADGAARSANALSTRRPSFVRATRDRRRCASPRCGGWFLEELNRGTNHRYVSDLDFANASLDRASIDGILGAADGEIVLEGRLGDLDPESRTRRFLVDGAFRGLPDVSAAPTDVAYQVATHQPPIVCFTAPCDNDEASPVNVGTPVEITRVDVGPASLPFVDQDWLRDRIELGGAIAAGTLVEGDLFPGGPERVLLVSQVYLRLPETVGPCPQVTPPQCGKGMYPAYARGTDRCELPDGCALPGVCTQYIPECPDGYVLTSWPTQPRLCLEFACDPAFSRP